MSVLFKNPLAALKVTFPLAGDSRRWRELQGSTDLQPWSVRCVNISIVFIGNCITFKVEL